MLVFRLAYKAHFGIIIGGGGMRRRYSPKQAGEALSWLRKAK